MKRYHNEAETPLKFHKVYHYLVIPYTWFIQVLTLFNDFIYVFYRGDFPFSIALDFVFVIPYVILTAIIFLGFYSFSGYAWYALMGYLGVRMLQGITAIGFVFIGLPENLLYELTYWSWDIVFPMFIALYYIKRKPLFFPQKYQAAVVVSESSLAGTPTPETPAPTAEVRFCVHCGKKLKDDYAFCPNCGAAR